MDEFQEWETLITKLRDGSKNHFSSVNVRSFPQISLLQISYNKENTKMYMVIKLQPTNGVFEILVIKPSAPASETTKDEVIGCATDANSINDIILENLKNERGCYKQLQN